MIYNFFDNDNKSFFMLETDLSKNELELLLNKYRKTTEVDGYYDDLGFFEYLESKGIKFKLIEVDDEIYF